MLAEERKNWHRMPTDSEWSTLENVVEVLKPLAYLTDALSGEKQVTASAILPVLRHVESKLNVTATDNQLATDMKQAIWSDLNARYADPVVSGTLQVASFLDPRFKDSMQNKESAIEIITEECLTYYGSVHGDSSDPPVESDEATAENAEAPPPKCLKGLAAILKPIQEESEQSPSSSLTPSQIIDKEISTYLDLPSLTQFLLPGESVNRDVSQTLLTLLGNTCVSVALAFPQKGCLAHCQPFSWLSTSTKH